MRPRLFALRGYPLLGVILAFLASCSPFEGTIQALGPGQETLKTRIEGLANIAASVGWENPGFPPGILTGSEQGLGYRILSSTDGLSPTSAVVWTSQERDKRLQAAQAQNLQTLVVPVWHVRPWLDQMSPLPSVAIHWTTAQLAEWLAWEWAAAKGGVDTPEKRTRVAFFSYKFAETLVIRMQGAGSEELARWRESVRDRQTFQTLMVDLRGQVRGILATKADPEEKQDTLVRIQKAWFNGFTQQYPNRFLTNGYLAFGATGFVAPLGLEALEDDSLGWEAWDGTKVWNSGASLWKALQPQ